MMHIISGNSVDVDDGDLALYEMSLRDRHQADRSDACEDDVEVKCPFVGMLPEESNTEDGSPLEFGARAAYDAHIKRQLDLMLQSPF